METGPAVVEEVEVGSPAENASVKAGDRITEIDGNSMRDLIDFSIMMESDTVHNLKIERPEGIFETRLETAGQWHGITIENPVFGSPILCNNDCVFCFIDQLPDGLRPSFYIKDDDYRLSFLSGNFITLTNLDEDDIARIIEDRLSPLYVSLHAYDQQLRTKIFNNPGAGRSIKTLEALIGAGIDVHVQIVLMKSLNDGSELDNTISNLLELGDTVRSIGIVPVGTTSTGRKALPREYVNDRASSIQLMEKVEIWNRADCRTGIYIADEFFYLAGMHPPDASYYDDFPQAENGIGLARLFIDGYLEQYDKQKGLSACGERGIITSPMGYWVLKEAGIESEPVRIEICDNTVFGPKVNVCGLMTGKDIKNCMEKLRGVETVLIPDIALNNGVFPDGLSLGDISFDDELRVIPVEANGAGMAQELGRID